MSWLLVLGTAILVSNLVTGLSLSVPPSVTLNEPFSATIDYNGTATYDVRLYVQSGESENLSKVIVEGIEKSTARYLRNAYPTQHTFTLKVVHALPHAELCVHIRESNKTKYEAYCQALTIHLPEQEETPPSSPSESALFVSEEEPSFNKENSEPLSTQSNQAIPAPISVETESETEPLYLSSAIPPSTHTKETLWKIGAFTLFSTIILILLLLRKI